MERLKTACSVALCYVKSVMANNILKILSNRNEYINHLENEIVKSNKVAEEAVKERDRLEDTIKNINALKIYPEHEAIIPLAKNIYLKGRIIHTGEFYMNKPAYPDSYMFLQNADQTLQSLNSEVKSKQKEIDEADYARNQLEESKKILEEDAMVTNTDQTEDIRSDKGVAVKVGDFYEIIEFE